MSKDEIKVGMELIYDGPFLESYRQRMGSDLVIVSKVLEDGTVVGKFKGCEELRCFYPEELIFRCGDRTHGASGIILN